MPDTPTDELPPPRVLLVITTRHLPLIWMLAVAFCLSAFVLRTYARIYDGRFGWTKTVTFGSALESGILPRLRRVPHYVDPAPGARFGYDGQYYAQLALDPSLRDPALKTALDAPSYRARRILLPAFAYAAALGKPRRVVQVYAVANLAFWFVLLGALIRLFRPWTGKQLLCLGGATLGFGAIASMERALVDLPAAAWIFAGAAIGSWGGCAALAMAALTRETSLLAVAGAFEVRRPWRALAMAALAAVPLAAWMFYVSRRFDIAQVGADTENFSLPCQAMIVRFVAGVKECTRHGGPSLDYPVQQLLVIVSLCVQGLFLLLRREVDSAFWRTGVAYLALGSVLGPSVWMETAAAARVLLPLTICFYLQLARERAPWFWPFFVLGSLSVPFGVREFWYFS